MKIYTRAGDDGTTGLFGGGRVSKADARIECYGAVDELNAALGLAAAATTDAATVRRLRAVQHELFVIGSQLAAPEAGARAATLPELGESAVARLEAEIDAAEAGLAPLKNFILPGGNEPAARLHLARTICRRAERLLVASVAERPLAPQIVHYMNRLSDWLFVQARAANAAAGVEDIPWVKD
jgi:cob(I)alamin adenosyltransferase